VPAYCEKTSLLRSAQLCPLAEKQNGFVQNSRQVTIFDPRSNKQEVLLRQSIKKAAA
jgi:hypothetical protein